MLTGAAFFKMREMFFEESIDDAKYCGHLYGLGTSFVNGGGAAVVVNNQTTVVSMTGASTQGNEGTSENNGTTLDA